MTAELLLLTRHQEDQLILLMRRGAGHENGAIDVYLERALNPGTLAKLQALGLTVSKPKRPRGGSQRTVYWLTDAGVTAVARIRNARDGIVKDPL